MKNQERISQYLHEHRAEMISDLESIVRIPSVIDTAEPGAPFGRECARCLVACAQLFRKYGFDMTVYPNSGYALTRVGPQEGKYVGIFAHSDVVPVTPKDWEVTEPFQMIKKDGMVFARGVNDNKNGVIAGLYLLRAFRDLEIPLRHGLVVFVGSNEESGMADVKAFVKEQPLPEASLVPDSGFPFSLGERAILRLNVCGSVPMVDVLELQGGQNYNTVMPSVRCVLRRTEALEAYVNTLSEAWLKVEWQDERIVLLVDGVSAHAGSPYKGESALKRLCALLADCPLQEADRSQLAAAAHAIEDYDGISLGIANEDEILGKLSSANGMVWMKDGCLTFTLDVRFGTGVTTPEVVAAVEKAVPGFSVEINYDAPAFIIPDDTPMARAINHAYCKAAGVEECKGYYMSGGTYCKHLPNAFATGTQIGASAGREKLAVGHGGAHQADECLDIECFLNGVAVLGQMALDFDAAI